MSYKPTGHNSVSPYLIVKDAKKTIAFLKTVFDAQELQSFQDPQGRLMHAEVKIEDSVIMLGDELPPDWSACPAHVHVYVKDVDATYAKALEAGATPEQKPVQKQDADKRGGVKDPWGTTWWIATRVDSGE